MPASPNWTPDQRAAAKARHDAEVQARRDQRAAAEASDAADRALIEDIITKVAEKYELGPGFTFIACRRGKPCIVGKGRKHG